MAQVRKYTIGGVYDRPDLNTTPGITAEDGATATIAATGASSASAATATTTAATAAATGASAAITSTVAVNPSEVGTLEINGIVRPFTAKAYAALTSRISALGNSINIGDFQHLIDLGSQKGNTLHFNSAYNQGYVTDASGNVIAKTQDGWRQRNGADVVLGGLVNSRKNAYNKELSTIFRGLTEDLFSEDAPTVETAVTDVVKNPFSTPLIWIDSNDKNEYSAYDPTIVAAKQRLDDIEQYISNKDLWGASNEFDESSMAVKNYIDSLGIAFTPEIRKALRDAINTPHLLNSDQKTILSGLNIGFGVRTTDANGNISYYTPEEWKEIQEKAKKAAATGGGNGGSTSTTTTTTTSTKNIFDSTKQYIMINNRTVGIPPATTQYDAAKSGLISSDKYSEIYKFVDLKGKEYYVTLRDVAGNKVEMKTFDSWDESVLGSKNSIKSIVGKDYVFNKADRISNNEDQIIFIPVLKYTTDNGIVRTVYRNRYDDVLYVGVFENDQTSFYKARIQNGKVIGFDRSKRYTEPVSKNKNGGVLFAEMGTAMPKQSETTPIKTNTSLHTEKVITKNPQKHSSLDGWRVGMAALATIGAGVGYVPVYGDAIGTVVGLVSDAGNFIIDLADKNVRTGQAFKNLGINAGLTALALLPGGDTAKLAKNVGAIAKTTANVADATKAAKVAVESAKTAADVNKAMKGVKTAVEASNAAIDAVKTTEKASKVVKTLKYTDEVVDTYKTTAKAASAIEKQAKAAKEGALKTLEAIEKTMDNASNVGKSLFWADAGKNIGQSALTAGSKVVHAGLAGYGALASGAAAIDVFSKIGQKDYDFTAADWVNLSAALMGPIAIGRRVQRTAYNRGVAKASMVDNHTVDGVRFTTSSTDAKTAQSELKNTWLRAGKTEDTLPELSQFGYQVKSHWFGRPSTVSEVKQDLPRFGGQMLRTNPYSEQLNGVTTNPFNPVSNWHYYNRYSALQAAPKWVTAPNYGYYGISPNAAWQYQYLHPGESESYITTAYKNGGNILRFKTPAERIPMPNRPDWLIKFMQENNLTEFDKAKVIEYLKSQQQLYDKWNADKVGWNGIADKYSFIKNTDGTYNFDNIAAARNAMIGEGDSATKKYRGFNWDSDVIDKLITDNTLSQNLTEDDLRALFTDYGTSYEDLRNKLVAQTDAQKTLAELEAKKGTREFDQTAYDAAKLAYDTAEKNARDAQIYLDDYKNIYASIKGDKSLGLGLKSGDIESARNLYEGSNKTDLTDYSDIITGLEHTSDVADKWYKEGKHYADFNAYVNSGIKRADRQGAFLNNDLGVFRTPSEKLDDADLVQAFEHTRNAKQIGHQAAADRRNARKMAKMSTPEAPMFNDTGLKEAEQRIEATTNTAMNDANMSTDWKANAAYKTGLNADKNNQFAQLGVQRSGTINDYLKQLATWDSQVDQIDYQNAAIDSSAEEKYISEVEDTDQKANNLNSSQLHQYLQGKKADFKEDRAMATGMDAKQQELKALTWQQMYGHGNATTASRIKQLNEEIAALAPKMRNLGWSTKYFA